MQMQALALPTMESELRALAWATLLTPACAVYARFAARRLRPGVPRLAALFPTFPVFVYMPWMFNSLHLRLFSTFFMFHAAFQIAERRARAAGIWRPPRPAAYLLVTAFMVVTISEMFFAPFVRAGTDVRLTEETTAMVELIWGTRKYLSHPFRVASS
uniref:Uncharacterized protein n=1 Tax=Zea mays TaxID=4577 RepID=B6TL72_MAIZE|nr:hypothetical protein [Zea mays]